MNRDLVEAISILGVQLSLCSREQLLSILSESVSGQRELIVLSGNIHAFNLAYQNPWMRDYFNQADIVRIDGDGLRLGARMLGFHTPKRMTWADFAWDLASLAADQGFSLFLLGAHPGIAGRAAARLKNHSPGLKIAGFQHGFFDPSEGSPENDAVIQRINAADPDILIVGMGMPLQERWLLKNRDRLEVKIILTGGSVFEYVSGNLRRGPAWMCDHGFEWLARLLIEPRRLWRRYLIGNPLFILRVIRERLRSIAKRKR